MPPFYLKRDSDNSGSGMLYINGSPVIRTFEPPFKDNQRNISSVPVGTYKVILTFSPKFMRRLPLLVGVPNRDGIRIHYGISPSWSKGCICVPSKGFVDHLVNLCPFHLTIE